METRIGLFGGSFDPVHHGHVLMARAALEELQLDRLYFIPAAQSPLKPENQPADPAVRLRLLRLALAGLSRCEIDEQELRRGGVSYTADTLADYARRHPGARLFYLIGADHVGLLPKWRHPELLAERATFVVIPRPGEACLPFPEPFRGQILQGFPFAVSSSQVRARIQQGLGIRGLVPEAVAEAIERDNCYSRAVKLN